MSCNVTFYLFYGATAPRGPGPRHCRGFTIILRHTALGRTAMDEWSARRRDLCPKQHTTFTRDRPPCSRWDSNPQSQQASDRRPTPYTARTLGSALRARPLVCVCVCVCVCTERERERERERGERMKNHDKY